MNLFEGNGNREAQIKYLDADFQILSPGSYVVCAITGKAIPLDELRYWSVAPAGTLCRRHVVARSRKTRRRAAEPEAVAR